MLNEKNPLWFCGFDPAEIREYLSQYSLHLIEDVGHEEYLERYIKPKGRDLAVMEIERTVLAEVVHLSEETSLVFPTLEGVVQGTAE